MHANTLAFLLLPLLPSVSLAAQVQTETLKMLPTDAAPYAEFGFAVATSGSVTVVGAREQSNIDGAAAGAAYLFDRATGQQTAKLLASDGGASLVLAQARFGWAVAVAGERAVVGAPHPYLLNNPEPGAAFIYDINTGDQLSVLRPSTSSPIDRFGVGIAMDGDTAIIAAAGNYGLLPATYVFDLVTGSEVGVLAPTDNRFQLNSRVALNGNLALLGASFDGVNGMNSGSAYLFDVQTGLQLTKFVPADGAPGDQFGSAVAFCNDIAVIGAGGVGDMALNAGAVYLFDVSSGTQLAKLYSSDPVYNNSFGFNLVGSGDRFVASGLVGAIGNAYVFDCVSGQQQFKLAASDGESGNWLGIPGIAFDGNLAVLGAYTDSAGGASAGAAYAYDLDPQANTGSGYCFGVGGAAACPCGANGGMGTGCMTSSGSGAALFASGDADVASDSWRLDVSGVPANKPGIFFQGNNQVAVPAGDGILCSNSTKRYGVRITNANGFVSQGSFGAFASPGSSLNYQFWFRDMENSCGAGGFNFTGGWNVTWQ